MMSVVDFQMIQEKHIFTHLQRDKANMENYSQLLNRRLVAGLLQTEPPVQHK